MFSQLTCWRRMSLLAAAACIGLGFGLDFSQPLYAQAPDPATQLYVSGIGVSWTNVGGPRRRPVAAVTIVDGYGVPVNGALVVGNWSDCFKQNNDSALTATYVYPQPDGTEVVVDGQAVIWADKTHSCWGAKQACYFTFTVTGVFLNGMTYIPVAGMTSARTQCF